MKNGPTLKIWHSPIPEFFCHVHFRCFKCFFGFCFFLCVFFFVFFGVSCVFFLCSFVFFLFAWCGSSSVLTWQCGLLCVAGVPFWRGSVVSCAWQVFFSDVAVWCPFHGCEKNTQKTHKKKNGKRKEKKQDKQIHLKQSKMNVEEQLCRICRLHSTNPELGNVKF